MARIAKHPITTCPGCSSAGSGGTVAGSARVCPFVKTEDFGKAQGIRAVRAGRAPVTTLMEINQLIGEGTLKPEVNQVFPLTEARKAQELSQTGHGRGRIVLKVV